MTHLCLQVALNGICFVQLDPSTIKFFEYINEFGLNRYLTWSYNETEDKK
jgi:hypothetical protein